CRWSTRRNLPARLRSHRFLLLPRLGRGFSFAGESLPRAGLGRVSTASGPAGSCAGSAETGGPTCLSRANSGPQTMVRFARLSYRSRGANLVCGGGFVARCASRFACLVAFVRPSGGSSCFLLSVGGEPAE